MWITVALTLCWVCPRAEARYGPQDSTNQANPQARARQLLQSSWTFAATASPVQEGNAAVSPWCGVTADAVRKYYTWMKATGICVHMPVVQQDL